MIIRSFGQGSRLFERVTAMMNLKKKIFIMISLAAAFVCVDFSIALAENASQNDASEKVQAQTVSEFAEQKGGTLGDYIKKLDLDNNTDESGKPQVIPCGEITCNRNTQKCMKCTTVQRQDIRGEAKTSYFTPSTQSFSSTSHKCIGKNDKAENYNNTHEDELYTYFVTCETVDFSTGDSQSVGLVTIKDGSNCNLKDASGNKYCLYVEDEEVVIEYNTKNMKGCEVLPVKLYNMRKCFFCPLFSVVFAASEKMTSISFSKLASAFATLIALGLAIWIAVQTLTHVSSLTKQDAPKFLGGLIKQSYKFLIAFLLLQYSSQIFLYGVRPILTAGIRFGGQFLELSAADENAAREIAAEINKRNNQVPGLGYYLPQGSESMDDQKNLYKELDGYVSTLQREISFMQAVGSSLICIGGDLMTSFDMDNIGDGFQMIIQGVLLAAFGFLLSIAYAFYMLDAVVQMGIFGALTPFLIACWPFKLTAKYTSTGFNMLMNSAFVFVFIGLCLEVNIQLVNAALTNQVGGAAQIQASSSDNISFGGLQDIANSINTQDIAELRVLTDISSIEFLILIFCCIFGFKFMGQVSSLAGQFAGSSMKPIAPSIATMGGSATLSAAKKVTQPAREAIGRKAEDLGMAVIGAVAHPVKTAKSVGKSVSGFVNRFRGGGSDNNGNKGNNNDNNDDGNKSSPKPSVVANIGNKGNKDNNNRNGTPVVGQNGNKPNATTQNTNGPRVGQNGGTSGNGGDEASFNDENRSSNDQPENNDVSGSAETSANAGERREARGPRRSPRVQASSRNQRRKYNIKRRPSGQRPSRNRNYRQNRKRK